MRMHVYFIKWKDMARCCRGKPILPDEIGKQWLLEIVHHHRRGGILRQFVP